MRYDDVLLSEYDDAGALDFLMPPWRAECAAQNRRARAQWVLEHSRPEGCDPPNGANDPRPDAGSTWAVCECGRSWTREDAGQPWVVDGWRTP
jgi:hypothetical protein